MDMIALLHIKTASVTTDALVQSLAEQTGLPVEKVEAGLPLLAKIGDVIDVRPPEQMSNDEMARYFYQPSAKECPNCKKKNPSIIRGWRKNGGYRFELQCMNTMLTTDSNGKSIYCNLGVHGEWKNTPEDAVRAALDMWNRRS